MKVAFNTAAELRGAIDEMFGEFPVALYYGLDSVAPFPDFQSHGGIEMYYVWAGSGGYLVGDRIYALQPGSLMIIRPYTPHKVLQTDPGATIGRHVLIWQEQLLPEGAFAPDPHPLERMAGGGLHIQADDAHRERLERIYADIRDEWVHRRQGFGTMIRSSVQQLLTFAMRLHDETAQETQPPVNPDRVPKEIVYLVQYVGSNFQSPLPLARLAELVHMNPPYLTTLFRKHTGYTLGQFILLKRLHHAKKLLRETDQSVSDIAYDCGFGGVSYFIKRFKEEARLTPEAFRLAARSPQREALQLKLCTFVL